MTILVTGANGQLGQSFRALADRHPRFSFLFAGSSELDITQEKAVRRFFQQHSDIAWCINCAAYTAVDKAETDVASATAVNVRGPRLLARACAEKGIPMVHYSTDYVYHAQHNTPLKETDPVRPKGVYARTKLAGERAAIKAHPKGVMVIRTSWVYALHGANFLRTMLRLGAERPALNVVFDQIGTPTCSPDLAQATLDIIAQCEADAGVKASIPGIWHYSNEGVCSWYDFAVAIMELAGLPCKVSPIESREYPTPAQRPPFSVLNKGKIKSAFGLHIPHWRTRLAEALASGR